MEPRKRTPPSKKSSIENKRQEKVDEKLNKLAEDVKKLPPERQARFKELLTKKAYTTEEAAKQLGVSISTVRRLMRAGKIAFFKVGPRIRISLSEIDRYGDCVTLKQAADILGVHKLTVTKLIKTGQLPAHRVSWPYRIYISDLEKFMESQREKPE